MAWTEYQTAGTIIIIIGIILLIAGIVILAIDQSNNTNSEWWVWALIVIGVITLLVGICLFFIPSPVTPSEMKMPSGLGEQCPEQISPKDYPKQRRMMEIEPHPECVGAGKMFPKTEQQQPLYGQRQTVEIEPNLC